MTARFKQQIAAAPQSRSEVESRHAPAGSAPGFGTIAAEDDHRTVEFAQHTAGDNAHHAEMPMGLAFDNREVSGGIKTRPNRRNDFLRNALFQVLPFFILGIEQRR